jgi:hypothetical protein
MANTHSTDDGKVDMIVCGHAGCPPQGGPRDRTFYACGCEGHLMDDCEEPETCHAHAECYHKVGE